MVDRDTRETIRQDLEQFWDGKLQKARKRYFRVAAEFHRQILERGEPSARPYLPDGIRRAEAEAFADYCRVLAEFTELVAIRGLPDSPQRAC